MSDNFNYIELKIFPFHPNLPLVKGCRTKLGSNHGKAVLFLPIITMIDHCISIPTAFLSVNIITPHAFLAGCNINLTSQQSHLVVRNSASHLPHQLLCFTKCLSDLDNGMWMQLLMTQLLSSDTRYSNTRSPLYVRRCHSTSTNMDK
jgi:hypothetical protein